MALSHEVIQKQCNSNAVQLHVTGTLLVKNRKWLYTENGRVISSPIWILEAVKQDTSYMNTTF